MADKYNALESEKKWQNFREENQTYKFDMASDKPIYSIDTPPPTVSGKIHIWHIFSYTQAELVARYKRMNGYNVFYPMGYDNNWIPTEQLVEKELNINIKDVERKDFIQKCLEVNEKYIQIYKSLWQSLWLSVDWSRSYSTISPEVQQIVQQEFVKLYNAWHIVSKEFPALRCTKMQTTVAQAETEEKEFDEFFNYLNFTLEDGEKLIIATTRPELLASCLAVFVHPDDERFTKYIWKNITTPLGVTVPLLADDKVKMDKWTWVVMCCSYGDEVDVFRVQKHNLWEKITIDRYWRMQNTWLPEIDGLKTSEAREKIMEILTAKWDIVVKRDPIVQSKQISERWKVPVEIIPIKQRFVNLLDKKDILLAKNNEMKRYPEFMQKRSDDRINNLQRDRNISRLRKFWIPIPVRYLNWTDQVILPSAQQLASGAVDPSVDLPEWYTADQVTPETLLLDTWFTSGLTPLINQKFINRDGGTANILPMDMRPQAHDIIRTRLLYTTLHAYFRDGNAPFKNIMMSGYVLASKWEKISKSKWNAKQDPEDLIKQRGADAVRYRALWWQLWKDMVFEENEFKNWQKLVTKLRNSFQFMKMQLADANNELFNMIPLTKGTEGVKTSPASPSQESFELLPTDQRIITRLIETIQTMTIYLDKYEYWLAKIHFEDFFWKDFCDNYLEMVKVRLYKPELFQDGESKKKAAQWTLFQVYHNIVKLIAPYLPHITEEIYQDYFQSFNSEKSIHNCKYPQISEFSSISISDPEKLKSDFEKFLMVVENVRKYKSEKQISMWAEITLLTIKTSQTDIESIQKYMDDLIWVTKAKEIKFIESSEFGVEITL
jgi:valyl-tRNA synthetase